MAKDILGRPVITAAELDAMTPAEREAVFEASVVTNLDDLSPAYVARLRANAAELIAERDAAASGGSARHAS